MRRGLRFIVLIREDMKVLPFADVITKAALAQLLRLSAAFHTSPLFQFTHVKPVKVYVRTHAKITRQWKSTLIHISKRKRK